MRTPEQQNAINVTRGWAKALTVSRVAVARRRQAALELQGVAEYLEQAWSLVDAWNWPVVGGPQMISQDSEAHARRGVGPSVDLPAWEGQELQPLVEGAISYFGSDGTVQRGNWVNFEWDGERGHWLASYAHLQTYGVLRAGHTGDVIPPDEAGAHVHLVLTLNGERVRPEAQPELVALLN